MQANFLIYWSTNKKQPGETRLKYINNNVYPATKQIRYAETNQFKTLIMIVTVYKNYKC